MGRKGTAWLVYSLVVNENLSTSLRPLSALPLGERSVVEVISESTVLSRRLLEIGCIEGATVEVVAVMWPGHDPLAVRIGGSTFALRRQEADLVMVR
jgi:ferrous iron transport protein A